MTEWKKREETKKEIIINRKLKMAGIGPNMSVIVGNVRIRKVFSLVTKRYSYKIKSTFKD